LVACHGDPARSPFHLRVAATGALEPVRPKANVDNWSSLANSLVFEPLLLVGEDDGLVPVLAARAERVAPHAVRLWLRNDITFSDGTPVAVDDLAQSFAGTHLRATRGPGESILVDSDEPAIPTELQLSSTYIHRRSPVGELGTGAFVVSEQDKAHILLRRRFPVAGRVGSVVITGYATLKEAFARTLKGDADILTDIDSRWLEFVEGVPRLRVVSLGPSPNANVIAFNARRLATDERRRLAYALSSDNVRKLAYDQRCAPPDEPARQAPPLATVGQTLDVLTLSVQERLGLAARRALGQRAGSVRLENFETFVGDVKAGRFDLATWRPQVSPPITAARNWRTGAEYNIYGYSNRTVDEALDAHDWEAARRALEADPPAVVICRPVALVVMDSRISNFSSKRFWRSIVSWEIRQ
jgi:ABC-type transport system substrate-binding protein